VQLDFISHLFGNTNHYNENDGSVKCWSRGAANEPTLWSCCWNEKGKLRWKVTTLVTSPTFTGE